MSNVSSPVTVSTDAKGKEKDANKAKAKGPNLAKAMSQGASAMSRYVRAASKEGQEEVATGSLEWDLVQATEGNGVAQDILCDALLAAKARVASKMISRLTGK